MTCGLFFMYGLSGLCLEGIEIELLVGGSMGLWLGCLNVLSENRVTLCL